MENTHTTFKVPAYNRKEAQLIFVIISISLAIHAQPVSCVPVPVDETILKIPAFGRITQLGSMYDARTDSFNGVNILLQSDLPTQLITTTQTPRITRESQIINKESDKFNLFGVDLTTAASIQTGIVQPEGTASFLSEDITSSKGVTGVFLQTFQTAEQTLPIFLDEPQKYFNKDARLYTGATHAVTGISWGGSIAVKFIDTLSSKRSSNILKEDFKKLKRTSVNIGRQPSSFEMYLTSDVSLQNALPTTLREVRGQINYVQESIKAINSGLGVPLKFTLTPISVLKNYLKVTTVTESTSHRVDEKNLHSYLSIIDDIKLTKDALINFEDNSNCVSNELHQEIEKLHSSFYVAEQNFKTEFKNILLGVKSGAFNNSALSEVLQNYISQELNPKNVRATLSLNAQALQKISFCSQLNEEYPDIQYFGSSSNLISKIFQNHNRPTYVLFTKSEFTENDRVSYEDNLNIFLNLLYKPSNALFIVDCDFSYVQCESINGTVIKQIRHRNYTFDDVKLEIKITEFENRTQIGRCNEEYGFTGAFCMPTIKRASAKSKTQTLNGTEKKPGEYERLNKVVGGNTANPNEFPFQVLFLKNDTGVHCGGSILSKNSILTSAHCLHHEDGYKYDAEDFESWTIVAGDHYWQKDEGTEQRRTIREVHIHEKYIPIAGVNDIAIVQLDRPLQLSTAVQPILLPEADYEASGNAVVTGWGRLQSGGFNPLVLKKVTVPIVDRADCVEAYEEAQVFVSVKMLCAGHLYVGGVDACQGDSGGPLSVQLRNGSSMLVGVVSGGIGCARPEYPGIYMQVSKYVDWINDTLTNFEIDDCLSSKRCHNGGTCVDGFSTYSCVCAAGYEGPACATVTNNCARNESCLNGGTCVNEINSYSCACAAGYEGPDCATLTNNCARSDSCSNGGICVNEIGTYSCICAKTFTGNQCEKVNKCRYPGTCAPPSDAGICHRCQSGFVNDPKDGMRCNYESGNASLMFSVGKAGLMMISLDGQNKTKMIQNEDKIQGTDYNFRTNTIFWFSILDNAIYKAPINGEGGKESIFQESPSWITGIAVDWVHHHLYWLNSVSSVKRHQLVVSNFNGSMKKVLFNDGLSAPRSIVVNPLNGWMYWTDAVKSQIERAGLDGSGREVILRTNIKNPYGLAVDFVDSRLYWSQRGSYGSGSSLIWSSDFNGSDLKLIFIPNPTQFQFPIILFMKIATLDKYVYFMESSSYSIYRVNKCNGEELEMIYKSESTMRDLKIFDATVQPDGKNLCTNRIAHCSHFCFPVPSPSPSPGNGSVSDTTCACPDGLLLSADKQSCV